MAAAATTSAPPPPTAASSEQAPAESQASVRALPAPPPSGRTLELAEAALAQHAAEVRVGIHDASRLEWSVAVPLPEGRPLDYAIDVELEIPSNAFARHAPWDQLQAFTRLDGPAAETIRAGGTVTIDVLRRGAVALANRMSRASDGFARHCRLAASPFQEPGLGDDDDLEETLAIWIDGAIAMAAEARAKLVTAAPGEAQELVRERRLVDEYVSVRLLEMLAGVERALAALLEARCPQAETFPPVVAKIERKVADALESELLYRDTQGFLRADPTVPNELERYLDRASQLKKHFQEVLFLEADIYQVAERIHHWVAAFVAVIASTWAFAWQIALMNNGPRSSAAGATVGSGIVVLAVIAGLVYAAKDRIKEVGRVWIAGNVHRFYAQRVARFRAPARRLPKRDVIVSARESFDQRTSRRPDPLNPDSGATLMGTTLRYVHKGTVSPKAVLREAGVRRIKHVYRYDLSPLFTRLDDAVKQVPVLDRETRRVRFVDAPRCYRLPVRVRVTCEGDVQEEVVTLVLHQRGLDRLERASELAPLKETGIEPDHRPEPLGT